MLPTQEPVTVGSLLIGRHACIHPYRLLVVVFEAGLSYEFRLSEFFISSVGDIRTKGSSL